ncbi:hypothetical protein EMIT0P171_40177 [Pseudomonas sp. IT-P171]
MPALGKTAVNNVSEHDVRALIRTVVSRGAHRQAISFFADLPQMFSWTRKRQPWRALLVEGAPTELVDISPLIPARKALSRRRHDDTLVPPTAKTATGHRMTCAIRARSMMQALGVSLDVIDRCQNHVLAGSWVRRHSPLPRRSPTSLAARRWPPKPMSSPSSANCALKNMPAAPPSRNRPRP